jgi:hypothetical protein
MIAAVALTIVLSPLQNPLLLEVIRKPTGMNGYEDYVASAIFLDRPENRTLERYVQEVGDGVNSGNKPQPKPASVPEKATTLDLFRLQAKAFEPAIQLIRNGNEKPTSYPNQPLTAVTLFPECSYFKTTTRVIQRSAYVAFADGDSAKATGLILDGLTFCRKSQVGGMIHVLVGKAGEQILYKAIERNLSNLSLKDVRAIRAWIRINRGTLASTVTDAAIRERTGRRADFDLFFANPQKYFQDLSWNQDSAKDLLDAVRQIPAKKRDEIYKGIFKRLEAPDSALIDRLKSPEREWLGPLDIQGMLDDDPLPNFEGVDPKAGAGLLLYLKALNMLSSGEGDEDMSRHMARYNIQERVLDLYMSVLEYRWLNGKLPGKLADVFGKEPIDPATEKPYVYEKWSEQLFRIYAQVKGIGDVSLVYKASVDGEKQIPPS